MKKKNPYIPGERVKFKDGDPRIFVVHTIYSEKELSLGLYNYPDTEMDCITNINEIIKNHETSRIRKNNKNARKRA